MIRKPTLWQKQPENTEQNSTTLSRKELNRLGHLKKPKLRIIRDKCVDCCGGNPHEVKRCGVKACALWPYRMGKDPFRKRSASSKHMRNLIQYQGKSDE